MNSELDNLKNGWKTLKEISENDETHTKNQLQEILKKDSKQIGHRFRKLLLKETILSIVFAIFFGVLALITQNSSSILWAIMFLIYVVNSIWMSNLVYKFPTQSQIESSLHNSLEEQIKIAKRFISIYTKSNIMLAAPSTLIGFLAGLELGSSKSLLVYFDEMIQNEHYTKLLVLLVIGIVLAFIMTYLIKKFISWYIKKTYGKYLEQLITLKNQLSE